MELLIKYLGLTETCGASTFKRAHDLSVGHLGGPLACNGKYYIKGISCQSICIETRVSYKLYT
jgi:hypothetical protein